METEKNGEDLYNPEDSFQDPNDITIKAVTLDKKDEDKIWSEVDKELDTILDSTEEKEEKPEPEPKKAAEESPKPKPVRGGPRARRGRKAN